MQEEAFYEWHAFLQSAKHCFRSSVLNSVRGSGNRILWEDLHSFACIMPKDVDFVATDGSVVCVSY
jgi:hypothetical protein